MVTPVSRRMAAQRTGAILRRVAPSRRAAATPSYLVRPTRDGPTRAHTFTDFAEHGIVRART